MIKITCISLDSCDEYMRCKKDESFNPIHECIDQTFPAMYLYLIISIYLVRQIEKSGSNKPVVNYMQLKCVLKKNRNGRKFVPNLKFIDVWIMQVQ